MEYGKVKWFSNRKGYGFIERSEGGPDAFVHYSDIQEEGWKSLEEDQKVQFELEDTDEGPRAKEIEKIESFPESTESTGEGGGPDDAHSGGEGSGDESSPEPPEAFKSTGPAVDSEQEEVDVARNQESGPGEPAPEQESAPVTPSSVFEEEDDEPEEEQDVQKKQEGQPERNQRDEEVNEPAINEPDEEDESSEDEEEQDPIDW